MRSEKKEDFMSFCFKCLFFLFLCMATGWGTEWRLDIPGEKVIGNAGEQSDFVGYAGMQLGGGEAAKARYQFREDCGLRTAVFPHHACLDLSTAEKVTLGVSVKPLGLLKPPCRVQLITKGADSMKGSWELFYEHLREDDYTLIFYCHPLNHNRMFVLRGKGILQTYQWNDVRVIKDGNIFSLYLNGEKISSCQSEDKIPYNNAPLRIGHYAFGREMMFPGIFSRLVVSKSIVLPETKKENLKLPLPLLENKFSKGITADCEPLTGNWIFSRGCWREYSDSNERDAWLKIGKQRWQKNYSFYAEIGAVDHMGVVFLDFYRQNEQNTYRLEYQVRETGNRTLRLWKIEQGKKQLIAEVPAENYKDLPAVYEGQPPLRFAVHRYDDLIAVDLNHRQWYCVKDKTFMDGGYTAVGCRGRKIALSKVKILRYPFFSPDSLPQERKAFELIWLHDWKRHAFYRGEKINLKLVARNHCNPHIARMVCNIKMQGFDQFSDTMEFRNIEESSAQQKILSLDTAQFACGDYQIIAEGKSGSHCWKAVYPITVALSPAIDDFYFSSWSGGVDSHFLEQLHRNGFNGASIGISMNSDLREELPLLAMANDAAIRRGMILKINYDILHCRPKNSDQMRIRRADGTLGKLLNPANPQTWKLAQERTEQLMRYIKNYPAFKKVLINSEIENNFEPSFDVMDQQRAVAELGFQPPSPKNKALTVDGTSGRELSVPDKVKREMPCVFPDDNQWYRYLCWFWQKGFGDVNLHRKVNDIIKKHVPSMRTTHDPFRDVPLLYRNLGLDSYGTWFYTGPDAGPAWMAVESLRAACQPGQKIGLAPSLWLYQSHYGPAKSRWAGVQPEALYMEALWLCLAACPDELDLFGVDFLMPGASPEYCPPKLLEKLRHFSESLLQPYWSLLQNAERHARSALLLSMGSQIFSHSRWGGYGWHESNAFLNLLWRANLPTEILFEEHIRKDALDDYDLLFLNGVTHLPESVYKKILKFQQKGGRVVCDNANIAGKLPGAILLVPELDIILKSSYYQLKQHGGYSADQVYAAQLKWVRKIKELFAADSSDVFAQSDSCESYLVTLDIPQAKLVLAVNDKRTFGDYLGKKFRAVYDGGLAQPVRLFLKQDKGVVYDLGNKKKLPAVSRNGHLEVPLVLPPSGGVMLAVYNQEIHRIVLKKTGFQAGGTIAFSLCLEDKSGKLLGDKRCLRLNLTRPDGTLSPWSRNISIVGGKGQFDYRTALNDPKGMWKLQVEEIASGISEEIEFRM